jgi:hypothetical protein
MAYSIQARLPRASSTLPGTLPSSEDVVMLRNQQMHRASAYQPASHGKLMARAIRPMAPHEAWYNCTGQALRHLKPMHVTYELGKAPSALSELPPRPRAVLNSRGLRAGNSFKPTKQLKRARPCYLSTSSTR